MMTTTSEVPRDVLPGGDEHVWICARDRARLSCLLRQHDTANIELEVTRNGRLYGTYRFAGQLAARTFADRLRDNFTSNGWTISRS